MTKDECLETINGMPYKKGFVITMVESAPGVYYPDYKPFVTLGGPMAYDHRFKEIEHKPCQTFSVADRSFNKQKIVTSADKHYFHLPEYAKQFVVAKTGKRINPHKG